MNVAQIKKFLKKNSWLLAQITILLLPLIIFLGYFSLNEINNDSDIIPELEKMEIPAVTVAASKVDMPSDKKESPLTAAPASFEIDEVSQKLLEKNVNNPQELLAKESPCTHFENVRILAKHTGTISKAKNTELFKKPLPAIITEMEYTCVNQGTQKVLETTMGEGVDSETQTLHCIQSNSDVTMDREARFRMVLKTMTHHCGFKLSEHHLSSTDTHLP